MDAQGPPSAAIATASGPAEVLEELVAAIRLVARGTACRVVVANLEGIDSVADRALAWAQALGVRFAVARDATGRVRAVIGPRAE